MTVTDYFSKWPEAKAIPTKEARHVAEFLYTLFMRHGFCPCVISDQGREFCNQITDCLFELTGTEHRVTSAYHPQSNGLVERFNQTLIVKKAHDNQHQWDQHIDSVLFAYRTSTHKSTKMTPFFVMHLREKYPVPGLQNTLLGSTLSFDVMTDEFVQVLHSSGNHWLTISV